MQLSLQDRPIFPEIPSDVGLWKVAAVSPTPRLIVSHSVMPSMYVLLGQGGVFFA